MEINGNQNSSKKYVCKMCHYSTSKKYNFGKHLATDKHRVSKNGNLETNIKPEHKYNCLSCDNKYVTKSGLWKHTNKCPKKCPEISILGNQEIAKVASSEYVCNFCKETYNTKSGLWKHSKKCNKIKTQMIINVIKDDKNIHDFLIEQNKILIEQLTQQNKNLMEQNSKLLEIASTTKIETLNNTSVNSHNKFNINVFLNETCKDAINLSDFVEQINLSLEDLEETSKVGYAEGISNVFIRNLKAIDYNQRPIHCNDYKREVLYIKDDNQWVKDDRQKLTNAIKTIANKNIKQIPNWQKANPEYNNPESKQNDRYMKMLCEVMSGSTKEEQQKNYNKIIRNISKESVIDKHMYKS